MATSTVSRTVAHRTPTHHQFMLGFGYIPHSGPPDLPEGANGNKNCAPPNATKDGTVHLLKPPTGAEPLPFVWSEQHGAWKSTKPWKGNRLAWPHGHLTLAGWEYIGPAPEGTPAEQKPQPADAAAAKKKR